MKCLRTLDDVPHGSEVLGRTSCAAPMSRVHLSVSPRALPKAQCEEVSPDREQGLAGWTKQMPVFRAIESSVIYGEGLPERKELHREVALAICIEIPQSLPRY